MATQLLHHAIGLKLLVCFLDSILVDGLIFRKEGTHLLHIVVISNDFFNLWSKMFSSKNKQRTHTHKSHACLPHSIWSSKKRAINLQFPGDSIKVTFSSPSYVGGHLTNHWKRVTFSLTIPQGSRLESPAWCFFFQSDRRWAEISRWCWDRKVEFEWCLLGLAWGGNGVLLHVFFLKPKL